MAVNQASVPSRENEFEFTDGEFNTLVNIVFEKTGIHIQPHKKTMIYGRIAKRIRKLGLNNFSEYISYLTGSGGADEMMDFINAVTTNLTKFFREMHHFENLKKVSIPWAVSKNSHTKRLRIWSAGCSAGMEPYSIAMTLRDAVKDVDRWDARILATDIDTNMLSTGTQGEYRIDEFENIPQEYQKEFVKVDAASEKMKMSEKLRKLITFKQLNFIEPWPVKGPFDIIFCRNVVIYFKKETQKVIFDKFADVLAPDGFLYIGHSESLHNVSDRFQLIDKTTYRKIK